MYEFRWIPWNLDKISKHNVARREAEFVVNHPARGFPRRVDDDKIKVWGQTADGAYLQVIFVIEEDDSLFVIHARPLTQKELRQLRRGRRP